MGLLNPDPLSRLGSTKCGVRAIKIHPFLKGMLYMLGIYTYIHVFFDDCYNVCPLNIYIYIHIYIYS
jgi:hypothetical protein